LLAARPSGEEQKSRRGLYVHPGSSLIVERPFLALYTTRERRAIAHAAASIQDAFTPTTDHRRVAA
jgi:hypothetical protein